MKASRSITFGDGNSNQGELDRLQCPYGAYITSVYGHYGMIGPYRNKETILDVCVQCSDGTRLQTNYPDHLLTHDKAEFEHNSKNGFVGIQGTWEDNGHWFNRSSVLTGLYPVPIQSSVARLKEERQDEEKNRNDNGDNGDNNDDDEDKNSKTENEVSLSSSSFLSSSTPPISQKNNETYADKNIPINTNNKKFQYYCRDNTLLSGLHFRSSSQASISVCAQCGPLVTDEPPSVLVRNSDDREYNELPQKEKTTEPTTENSVSHEYKSLHTDFHKNKDQMKEQTLKSKWTILESPMNSHSRLQTSTTHVKESEPQNNSKQPNSSSYSGYFMTPEQKQEWLETQTWTWTLQTALQIEFVIVVIILVCVFVRLILYYLFPRKYAIPQNQIEDDILNNEIQRKD